MEVSTNIIDKLQEYLEILQSLKDHFYLNFMTWRALNVNLHYTIVHVHVKYIYMTENQEQNVIFYVWNSIFQTKTYYDVPTQHPTTCFFYFSLRQFSFIMVPKVAIDIVVPSDLGIWTYWIYFIEPLSKTFRHTFKCFHSFMLGGVKSLIRSNLRAFCTNVFYSNQMLMTRHFGR